MGDLERLSTSFSHQTINSTTLETSLGLLTLVCHSSDDGGLSEGIILRFAKGNEEFSAVELGEKNARAVLQKSVVVDDPGW